MRWFPKRKGGPKQKWGLWRWYDIVIGGKLYLTRLQLLKTPWFSIKLHWIHLPDPDRDLHNHPWNFAAFVLCGGYTELVNHYPHCPGLMTIDQIKWFNFKNSYTSHRIAKVKPKTLTLVVTGPKTKSWGFYDYQTGQFTDWKRYGKIM